MRNWQKCLETYVLDVICIFTTNLVNVGMRMEEAFYNRSMYLYYKNVLEYAQIARNETESNLLGVKSIIPIKVLVKIRIMPVLCLQLLLLPNPHLCIILLHNKDFQCLITDSIVQLVLLLRLIIGMK